MTSICGGKELHGWLRSLVLCLAGNDGRLIGHIRGWKRMQVVP